MIFNFDNYGGDAVMHCATKQECEIFMQFLHSIGKRWFSGRSYMDGIAISGGTPDDACFKFALGVWGPLCSYANDPDIEVLEFSDFDWPNYEGTDIEYVSSDDLFAIDCFLEKFAITT